MIQFAGYLKSPFKSANFSIVSSALCCMTVEGFLTIIEKKQKHCPIVVGSQKQLVLKNQFIKNATFGIVIVYILPFAIAKKVFNNQTPTMQNYCF
jgi:hypothetical protein